MVTFVGVNYGKVVSSHTGSVRVSLNSQFSLSLGGLGVTHWFCKCLTHSLRVFI